MENQSILTATFNPKIKGYIFFLGVFILLISFIGWPILVIWILGLGQYVGKRYYNSLACELSNHHLEFRKGVFFKVEKTIPLENIQDLTFIQNPILNFFNLKILKIETAGNGQSTGADMKLVGILEVEKFKTHVLKQRENLNSIRHHHTANNTDLTNETNMLLREIRDLLATRKL